MNDLAYFAALKNFTEQQNNMQKESQTYCGVLAWAFMPA